MAKTVIKTCGAAGSDYATWQEMWRDIEAKDFVSDDEQWDIHITSHRLEIGDGNRFTNTRTDRDHYPRIMASPSRGAYTAKLDSGPSLQAVASSANIFTLGTPGAWIKIGYGLGLVVVGAGGAQGKGVHVSGSVDETLIDGLFCVDEQTGSSPGQMISLNFTSAPRTFGGLWNTIVLVRGAGGYETLVQGGNINGAGYIRNNTVFGNGSTAVGFDSIGSSARNNVAMNCVASFAGSTGWYVASDDDGASVVDRSLPNLSATDEFVDPFNGDFRLKGGSSLIDWADNAQVPDHDLAGAPRVEPHDTGAYDERSSFVKGTRLEWLIPPPEKSREGVFWTPPVQVQITNGVDRDMRGSRTVTLVLESGSGQLLSASAASVYGVATFANVSADLEGMKAVVATAGGLEQSRAHAVEVEPAATEVLFDPGFPLVLKQGAMSADISAVAVNAQGHRDSSFSEELVLTVVSPTAGTVATRAAVADRGAVVWEGFSHDKAETLSVSVTSPSSPIALGSASPREVRVTAKATRLSWVVSPPSEATRNEAWVPNPEVEAVNDDGVRDPDYSGPVRVTLSKGGGALTGVSAPMSSGVVTLPVLRYDQTGSIEVDVLDEGQGNLVPGGTRAINVVEPKESGTGRSGQIFSHRYGY